MSFKNYSDLTRGDGRWITLWAAFDVTGEYLGTFTLDELRAQAADASKWVGAVQYRSVGQRIDDKALSSQFNGLFGSETPFSFDGFRISPVRHEPRGSGSSVEVCAAAEHEFWSIYGFHRASREWLIVHDCEDGEEGEMLARLVDLTGHLIEYRDTDHAYANTRLVDLPVLLAERIHDEIPDLGEENARLDDSDTHPLTPLRESILAALAARDPRSEA